MEEEEPHWDRGFPQSGLGKDFKNGACSPFSLTMISETVTYSECFIEVYSNNVDDLRTMGLVDGAVKAACEPIEGKFIQ